MFSYGTTVNGSRLFCFHVNSWGRENPEIISNHAGEGFTARFCVRQKKNRSFNIPEPVRERIFPR